METDADRLTLVGPPFGTQVQVGAATVWGIFGAGFAEDQGMEGTSPSLTCRTSDVAAAVRGTAVIVPGVGNFKVVTPRPDGTGITRIILEKT